MNSDVDYVMRDQDEQQIPCEITHNKLQKQFTTAFVYVKCKYSLRRPLWDKILQQSEIGDKPWCSMGDYNIKTSTEEKLRGIPYNIRKRFHLIAIIQACGLMDIGFIGKKYTWSTN